MERRVAFAVAFALLSSVVCVDTAGACGHRSYYYCPPSPCWVPFCPTPCDPCCVYTVSPPVVPVKGPFPTLLRQASLGSGVIVQFEVPMGSSPFPADQMVVLNTAGPGEMSYTGWNKRVATPGLPGSPTLYSIFLCPVKRGNCTVEVTFFYANGTSDKVPFVFEIR